MQYAVVITVVIAKPAQHTTDRKSSFGTYIPRRPRRGRPPLSVRSGIWDGALFVRDSITIYLCRVASASVTRFFFVAGDRNHAA